MCPCFNVQNIIFKDAALLCSGSPRAVGGVFSKSPHAARELLNHVFWSRQPTKNKTKLTGLSCFTVYGLYVNKQWKEEEKEEEKEHVFHDVSPEFFFVLFPDPI